MMVNISASVNSLRGERLLGIPLKNATTYFRYAAAIQLSTWKGRLHSYLLHFEASNASFSMMSHAFHYSRGMPLAATARALSSYA